MAKTRKTTEANDRNVLTVRIPAELHEELRTYGFFTHRSINETVVHLIQDFLAGPGREEIAQGMTDRAKSMYGVALDKLADM